MYISQDIANRIKLLLKSQNKNMKDMLTSLGLGINIISQLAKGQAISSFNLAKIADYLNCSVDYLLGRTNNVNDSHIIPYDGEDPQKQELSILMQEILDNVKDETQLQQIKMFLETYKVNK